MGCNRRLIRAGIVAFVLVAGAAAISSWAKASADPFTDYRGEWPGRRHEITAQDLPRPYATQDANNRPGLVRRPKNAWPKVPPGFKVGLYASGLYKPRLLRAAPNGDLFLAESWLGRILVFRGINKEGRPEKTAVFAAGLDRPFGIAFYPPGPNPRYVYIGETDKVVRFAYRNGDLQARGPAQTIIARLPTGGHWTRDVVFSADGKTMFVSVGSRSNDGDTPAEYHRANILAADPDGNNVRVYAWGLRNAVSLVVDARTGALWAAVSERDRLGDDLPPDYVTRVKPGGFYGWPWFYIGGHQYPNFQGAHPELKDKVVVPDVLIQPHDTPLGLVFYEGTQFPARYRGDLFVAAHGSWNRGERTGYEVILVPVKNGRAEEDYQDFMTGFVRKDGQVWGRPVGVAVAADGFLLVSDDASGSIWRVSFAKPRQKNARQALLLGRHNR